MDLIYYFILFLSLFLVVLFIMHIRYPLIYKHYGRQNWTVGVAEFDRAKFEIKNILAELSPEAVKAQTGFDAIADPWIIKNDDKWFLFVEVLDMYFGRIAVFESSDLRHWDYSGIALDEAFHLSYPQVFEHKGEHYMIPESARGGGVFLYKATSFPLQWECSKQLLKGNFLDSTLFVWDSVNYLITYDRAQKCRLFYSEHLYDSEWKEHPKSPLGIGNRLRPGGRAMVFENKVLIPVQCNRKGYGSAVYGVEITKLSKTGVSFSKTGGLLLPFKSRFFSSGVHHMDVYELEDNMSIIAFDGRAGTSAPYKRINAKTAIRNNIYDLFTFLRLPCRLRWLE